MASLVTACWEAMEREESLPRRRVPDEAILKAVELRRQGMLYKDIGKIMGVSGGSAWYYVSLCEEPVTKGPKCCHCGMRLELVATVRKTDDGQCCDMCYHHVKKLKRKPAGPAYWSEKGREENDVKVGSRRRGTPKVPLETRAAVLADFAKGGMLQQEIAAKHHVSEGYVSKYVRGLYK